MYPWRWRKRRAPTKHLGIIERVLMIEYADNGKYSPYDASGLIAVSYRRWVEETPKIHAFKEASVGRKDKRDMRGGGRWRGGAGFGSGKRGGVGGGGEGWWEGWVGGGDVCWGKAKNKAWKGDC